MSKLALAVIGFSAFTLTLPASAYTGEQHARLAKITLKDARAIALEARPGKIVDEELEPEPGGSGLRYSFDIKSNGVVYEVGIDAKTTRVLENRKEEQNPD